MVRSVLSTTPYCLESARVLEGLCCPTGHPFELAVSEHRVNVTKSEGVLVDRHCGLQWPIEAGIPRFARGSHYVTSFGEQWNRYLRTQIDRFNGTTITRDRFYSSTGWAPYELNGSRVLEVGCGAGRFTQILLDAGAEVWAFDLSTAVDACLANNGPHPRLHVVQADLHQPPFRQGYFDYVVCFGVLQHTPDPHRAFLSLPRFLRSGGRIAIDIYAKRPWWPLDRWMAKRWYRPLTRRLPPRLLAAIVEAYVPGWLPIDNFLYKIDLPKLGRCLVAVVPCWNYTGILPLSPQQIMEWAILDTYDALASWYDHPRDVQEVRRWFAETTLADVGVHPGGNGIVGRARHP